MNHDAAIRQDTVLKAMDRHLQEQLLLLLLINSLRHSLGDDVADGGSGSKFVGGVINIEDTSNGTKYEVQAAIVKELLNVAQRLLDAQLLDALQTRCIGKDGEQVVSSSSSALSSDQHVVDDNNNNNTETSTFETQRKHKAAAKKKRNRRNKAIARRKKRTIMSWCRGAGTIPQMIIMAVFSSITTLFVVSSFSIIHQSDGSEEGRDPPALSPTSSKSLRRGLDQQHEFESNTRSVVTSASIVPSSLSSSPTAVNTTKSSNSMSPDEEGFSFCFDTPNWKDRRGNGCERYYKNDASISYRYITCSEHGYWYEGSMGTAVDNCCVCGGGSRTRYHIDCSDASNDGLPFCLERNVLSDIYNATRGGEKWRNDTNWLDDYTSHCDWKGVRCVNSRVTELRLHNNGLMGTLSGSIGNLTALEVLDLSDNEIQGSIPAEIGLLSNLRFLRLSYNLFTGEVPENLAESKKLELLQLQSNFITRIPDVNVDESVYRVFAFIADCAFRSECESCTMCCDLEGGCYQTDSVDDAYIYVLGSVFAFLTIPCYIIFCFMVRCFREKRRNMTPIERSIDEEEEDDLGIIDDGSVYAFFVTDIPLGWLIAFITLGLQFAILFLLVSFTEDGEIQNWTCPAYSDECVGTSYADSTGWAIYWVLMILYCAKDVINGANLIYHSSGKRHSRWKRIRLFCGGCGLFSVALVTISVSTFYNMYTAGTNSDLLVNAVAILFVTDIDEWIFSAIVAANIQKLSLEAVEGDDTVRVSEPENDDMDLVAEMKCRKEQIESQQRLISSQQEELRKIGEMVKQMRDLQFPFRTP